MSKGRRNGSQRGSEKEHSTPHSLFDYSECVGAHENAVNFFTVLPQQCSLHLSGNLEFLSEEDNGTQIGISAGAPCGRGTSRVTRSQL